MTKSLKFHLNSKLQLLECGDQIQPYCHRAGRRETVENYLNNHSEFCSQSFHILAANIGQMSCSHPLAAVSFQHSSNLGCPYSVCSRLSKWPLNKSWKTIAIMSLTSYQLTNNTNLPTSGSQMWWHSVCLYDVTATLSGMPVQCQWVNNNFTMKLDMHFLCLFCGDGDGGGS